MGYGDSGLIMSVYLLRLALDVLVFGLVCGSKVLCEVGMAKTVVCDIQGPDCLQVWASNSPT